MKGAFSLNQLVYPPRLFYFFSSKDLETWGELTDSPLDFVFCKEGVALWGVEPLIEKSKEESQCKFFQIMWPRESQDIWILDYFL